MKNHVLPQFFVFTAIIVLFALLFSQRGLSALAADTAQVETGTVTITASASASASPTKTVTPTSTLTLTPTLNPAITCANILSGNFVVTGGDDLQYTVTNNNLDTAPVTLTSATLNWTDYYDPDMLVDYFRFGVIQYWNGDDFDSPTTQSSSVPFSGLSTNDWNLDFDGYANAYGVTHTIGPFTVELTFNGNCVKSATIPVVVVKIINPVEHQVFGNFDQSKTGFEAVAWDTGVGTHNGDGIERVHLVILDSNGTEIVSANRQDTIAPYCMWGSASPCPNMPTSLWNSLPNGIYTMIAWGKSSVTASWSAPYVVQFKLLRTLPRPTVTPTPTP